MEFGFHNGTVCQTVVRVAHFPIICNIKPSNRSKGEIRLVGLRRVGAKKDVLGELRFTSRSFYKVEVKVLGGGYFNPSLCNLLPLAKVGK